MTRIFIPTIMHTGTHFCRHGLFGEFPRANPGVEVDGQDVVINIHVTEVELKRIKLELQDYDIMRIFNPTIMHTGTQFCRHILFNSDMSLEIDRLTVENERLRELVDE